MSLEVARHVLMASQLYNRTLDEGAILFFAEGLTAAVGEKDALRALKGWLMRGKVFPSIADLVELVRPGGTTADAPVSAEAEAAEVADRIAAAIERDGYTNTERARERIGELGWAVVEQCGGWAVVCRQVETYEQLATYRAQWRRSALGLRERALKGRLGERPALPAPLRRPGGPVSAGALLGSVLPPRGATGPS